MLTWIVFCFSPSPHHPAYLDKRLCLYGYYFSNPNNYQNLNNEVAITDLSSLPPLSFVQIYPPLYGNISLLVSSSLPPWHSFVCSDSYFLFVFFSSHCLSFILADCLSTPMNFRASWMLRAVVFLHLHPLGTCMVWFKELWCLKSYHQRTI